MQHVLKINQFTSKPLLDQLFVRADELQAMAAKDYPKPLQDRTLATLFFEPSTRTRLSFEAAIQNLGGRLLTVENANVASSAQKGETLEDTIRIVMAYADGIVMRHPEPRAAERAASVSEVQIINAGDGVGEHPTQALLDVYTLHRAKKTTGPLKVAMVGDLLNGRTVHSTAQLLAVYGAELYFVAPKSLQMPAEYLQLLDKQGVTYHLLDSFDNILGEVDVLYMTRVQKERFKTDKEYQAVKDSFILTLPQVQKMKSDALVLHALPRLNEIEAEIDNDPRAHYFQQAKNGLYARMALLEHLYPN